MSQEGDAKQQVAPEAKVQGVQTPLASYRPSDLDHPNEMDAWLDEMRAARTDGNLLLIIPKEAQRQTRFDQAQLGVVSVVTDVTGTSWITIDPKTFSRAFDGQ